MFQNTNGDTAYIASQGENNTFIRCLLVDAWYCIHFKLPLGKIVIKLHNTGPKPETVGDFWQMVWQENVFVIAMVTNLKEGDKVSKHSFKKSVFKRIPFFFNVGIQSEKLLSYTLETLFLLCKADISVFKKYKLFVFTQNFRYMKLYVSRSGKKV